MGCSFGTPLPHPNNGVQASEDHREIIASSPNFFPNSQQDDDDQIKPREFYSFSSFISKNQNPTIFEWTFIREIGKGSRSLVFLAQNTQTGQQCAAKVYDKSLLMRQDLGSEDPPMAALQREIEIMAALTNKFSITITEIIEDDLSNSLIILIPFAEHGSLQSYIQNNDFSVQNLAICFYQIAEALRYIHSIPIVHRNITPANILIFSDTLYQISNFSDSTSTAIYKGGKLNDIKGCPQFLSPEECSKKPFFPKPSDVWSYGISLYFVAFKKFPFNIKESSNENVNFDKYISQIANTLSKEELTFPDGASEDLKDLLIQILAKDPRKRPTFDKIVNHPWFREAKLLSDQMNNVNKDEDKDILEEEEEDNQNNYSNEKT